MDGDDYGDDEGDDGEMQPQHTQPQMRHNDHQPRMEGQRFEGHRGGHDQNRYRDRDRNDQSQQQQSPRPRRRDRHERHDRGGNTRTVVSLRISRAPKATLKRQVASRPGGDQFRRRDRFPQQQHEQPEFLRRPVRRPRREGNGGPGDVNGAAGGDETDQD